MVSSSVEFLFIIIVISSSLSVQSWCPQSNPKVGFKQRSTRFWQFEEETKTWVEISLPYVLTSCINGTCTKVGSIAGTVSTGKQSVKGNESDEVIPVRRRVSLNRMSEASVWVTGQSGSIFERFWNGVNWVIAPHELPVFAGYAVSTYIVNQTILALSEDGILYQLQLNEISQPIWSEVIFKSGEPNTSDEDDEEGQAFLIKSGTISYDGRKLFLSSIDGSLIEVSEFQPLRWENHGRPPGGDVEAIADTGNIKPGVMFTVSSSGNLYEFDKESKPAWKKHIWSDPSTGHISLSPSTGCTIHGLFGIQSVSLFLLSKDGFLVERRLHRRKWKWAVHGAPENQRLSSLTPIYQNTEAGSKVASLFYATTSTGYVFEYQHPIRPSGGVQSDNGGTWTNHMHPKDAKVAQSVLGVQLQADRTVFPLDDGRLSELHLPGLGGDEVSPGLIHNPSTRRKQVQKKYEWSILDVPETEGWNGEYCTEEHGPNNCIIGVRTDSVNPAAFRRHRIEEKQSDYIYTLSSDVSGALDSYNVLTRSIQLNFRMRVMHEERSLFLITDSGMTFEYLFSDGLWLWLRHEHVTEMKGAHGSYNGSLYLVDVNGNLLIRERSGEELSWINCTDIKKGVQVASGSPWDGIPGKWRRVTTEDALFFVNKRGRLVQFTVALRAFKWKDCQRPPDTKIAFIVDQEVFRRNIVFVVGRNGHLYQYNRITELWHQHRQSPYLILSRSPGTAMRPYHQSLRGSIFMFSEDGALVEYRWNSQEGWDWVEHGTPHPGVSLVGAPGPCFDGAQLFVIGSDGLVYSRHLGIDTWRWISHGHPNAEKSHGASEDGSKGHTCNFEENPGASYMTDKFYGNGFTGQCNEKVASVRPVPFSDYSVIFELQDGRLAELRRLDETSKWEWTRIIGTPTSTCLTSYWTAVAT